MMQRDFKLTAPLLRQIEEDSASGNHGLIRFAHLRATSTYTRTCQGGQRQLHLLLFTTRSLTIVLTAGVRHRRRHLLIRFCFPSFVTFSHSDSLLQGSAENESDHHRRRQQQQRNVQHAAIHLLHERDQQ